MSVGLWSVNRWLRFTGFRLFVMVDSNEPTRIGVGWYGWSGSERWRRIEGITGRVVGKVRQSLKALKMWTVYDSPSDYPGKFVVRKFYVGAGVGVLLAAPLPAVVADSLDEARAVIPNGLDCFARQPGDSPSIMETWL